MNDSTDNAIAVTLAFLSGVLVASVLIAVAATIVHDAAAQICPSKQTVTRCVEMGRP